MLRKILSAHSKCPSESLYLELGVIPIKFIIVSRRLNFLHYILKRPEHELLKRFFDIQSRYPVKHDWVLTIKDDLKLLGFSTDFEEITKVKKRSFAKIVKEKIRKLSFDYLLKLKNEHSKMSRLSYSCLKVQTYFKNSKISAKQAKSIFKYRSHMADVKDNFHSMIMNNDDDLNCPECHNNTDNQEHLLDHIETDIDKSKYNNIFKEGYHEDKLQ